MKKQVKCEQPHKPLNKNVDCNIIDQSETLSSIVLHTVNCPVAVFISQYRGYM